MLYLLTHSTHVIYGYMVREETCFCHIGYSFYMHHYTDRIAHTTAFVTPVVEHWLKREIAQWVHHEGLIPSVIYYHRHCLQEDSHPNLNYTSISVRFLLFSTKNLKAKSVYQNETVTNPQATPA